MKSWSEWQDSNLRPLRAKTSTYSEKILKKQLVTQQLNSLNHVRKRYFIAQSFPGDFLTQPIRAKQK
jgi:hypothetical protein